VAANAAVSVSAALGGVTKTASLTVKGWVVSVAMNPASVAGGSTSTGTVTLSAPAPSGGATVSLASANTAAATIPVSIVIPAGSTTGTFTATTKNGLGIDERADFSRLRRKHEVGNPQRILSGFRSPIQNAFRSRPAGSVLLPGIFL
jgi:hypothetical protein